MEIQNTIASWVETSAAAMLKTCNSEWGCSNFWLPNATNPPRDVHNQINSVFIANALSLIKKVKIDRVPLPPSQGNQGELGQGQGETLGGAAPVQGQTKQSSGAQSAYGLVGILIWLSSLFWFF